MANSVSHDQNFKNLILDYPRDALALYIEFIDIYAGLTDNEFSKAAPSMWQQIDNPESAVWPSISIFELPGDRARPDRLRPVGAPACRQWRNDGIRSTSIP